MTQQDPLVGKVLAERFEILSRIGEGGIGVVYKAKQITVDRIIAIKVLGAHVSQDPSWVKRFHNEARAAARLDHPNTVRLIDFGETKEGLLFIAMEFLQGRSMADEIARVGRLPPGRVLRILQQILQSLQEAHSAGIIHRDIKPDNVFLMDVKGGGDFVKVLDFSVAKMDTPDAQATRAGTVFGTPAYMSPEQGRGVKLTAHSDIYAVGVVAYEMLTGKPPFDGRLPMEVVMKHLTAKPAPLVGFPEPVANLVMKSLEKAPEARFQSAEEMDRACQACLDQIEQRAIPAQPQAGVSANVPPPVVQSNVPPPVVQPNVPPPVDAPVRHQDQRPDPNKTILAEARPQGNSPAQGPAQGYNPAAAANKTVAFQPQGMPQPQGPQSQGPAQDFANATVFIPDRPGVSPQALVAKQAAMVPRASAPPGPGAGFWAGWALLGIGLGLLLHFLWPVG